MILSKSIRESRRDRKGKEPGGLKAFQQNGQ